MKKIILALVAILAVVCLTPTTALSQATVGTATITAQGAFTLNGGDILTLQAQLTGCFANVPLYAGNPISLMPNQPTNGFTANSSQVVALTLPGNDKIICGLQSYTMYALTWRVNGYPVTPTKTYRFSDATSYNLALAVPVGFVPPVLANAAGALCGAGQALTGFDKDYHPVCQAFSGLGGSGFNGGTLTGNLFLNGDPTSSNQAATKSYVDSHAAGPTVQACNFTGATADVQIRAALVSVATGGTVDARCYHATTQTIAATLALGGTGQIEIDFDPTTNFIPSAVGLNMFTLLPGATVDGLSADTTAFSAYSGAVMSLTGHAYDNTPSTNLSNFKINAVANNTGVGLLLNADSTSHYISWVTFRNLNFKGMLYPVKVSVSNSGWVNANTFYGLRPWGSIHGIVTGSSDGTGEVSANKFYDYSVEPAAGALDGISLNAGTKCSGNQFLGADVWDLPDATNSINIASVCVGNNIVGYLSGFINDGSGDGNVVTNLNSGLTNGAPSYVSGALKSPRFAVTNSLQGYQFFNGTFYENIVTGDGQNVIIAPENPSTGRVYVQTSGGNQVIATQDWVTQHFGDGSGVPSGGGTDILPSGIGTIVRQGVLTDGNVAYKTCYVGSSVCSGGVGSNAPSSSPSRVAGLNTPSAGSGTSNAVASYGFSTNFAKPQFTDVLWTTTGGGLGADTTSTNWYRDFYVRTAYPGGHTHLEFDTYNFDGTWDWMWGTQCNATKNIIQIDNQTNGWIDTPIPCAILFDGNYHHIQQTFHRDLAAAHNCASNTAPCQWWDAMAIDDHLYAIGRSLPATATTWTGSGGQIQTDTEPDVAPANATVYIDTDTVIAGLASDANNNPGGNGGNTTTGTGELGSFSFDGGSPINGLTAFGTPSIQTSNVHSATKSALFPASTNSYYTFNLPVSGQILYTRQYVFVTSIGTNAMSLLRFYHGGQELWVWYLSTGGVLTAFDQQTSANIGTGYTLGVGAIHLIETYTKISATAGQVIAKVDGTTVFTSAATLNTGTASIDTVWFGAFGASTPAGWGNTYEDNVDFSAVGFIGTI